MLVATLNTAPGIEPGTAAGFDPVKRGTWTPADGVGDIPAVRFFGEFEKGKEMWSSLRAKHYTYMLPSIYIKFV